MGWAIMLSTIPAANPKTGKSFYRPLRRNIILAIFTVTLVPLLLSYGVLLYHFQDSYREKVIAHLHELMLKHVQAIDSFLADRLADIRVLSRANDPAVLADESFLRTQLNLLREEFAGKFVDLGLVNSEGIQVSYAGPYNLTGADYSKALWFRQASKNTHYISDVFSGLRGSPHFIVAVRMRRYGQTWILRATVDIKAFNSLVENVRQGETGFAFIANRDGELETRPRFPVDISRQPYIGFIQEDNAVGKVVVAEKQGQDGHDYILAVGPLRNGRWILFYQQELSDALRAVRVAELMALAVMAAVLLAVLVMSIMVSGRLVRRIAKSDAQKRIMDEKVLEAGRLASIGELAAGIAHEINNPVAIMVEEAGWLEDLMEDGELDSRANQMEFQRALGQIKAQGARCKTITHKLLSFARKTDPVSREISANEIVQEAISLLGQKSRYANVKIQAKMQPGLPEIKASPSELQQVLVNLINNAVDAIDSSGGEVTVSTKHEGDQVLITVSDTGAGIPEANLNRIFDPFYTTKPVGQGTGLGLSICYGIVHKIGGDISVRSLVNQGTTFTISLPVADSGEEGS